LRLFRAFVLFSVAGLAGFSQSQPDDTLAAGREFVAALKLDQAADAAVFQQVGQERSAVLMTAVMSRGQGVSATTREWTDMHRALNGLIELYVAKGELFRAAVFGNLQDQYYRNDEGDYTAALAAARQALDLQQRSGQPATLYIGWKNVGEDLIRLGRVDEGLDALYQAHRSIDDPSGSAASVIWRGIVHGEISRHNLEAARRESDAFVRQSEATATPQLFRGSALLARADLEMEEAHYGNALDSVKAASLAVTGKEAELFLYEPVYALMSLGLVAMESLPYADAMALIGRIDHEFPKLPFPISAYARQMLDYRRRLAGDFEGLLHDDGAALQKARDTKNVRGQIDTLTHLAVTYSFAHSTRQQIAMLEEAMGLERSLSPAGVPVDPTAQLYYFRMLTMLGSAYADNKDTGKARQCFDEAAKGIGGLPEGAAKARLAKLNGTAQLGKALVAELDDQPDDARDILKKALNTPANGAAKFDRAEVLRQAARLERHLNEKPLEAVRYYEAAAQEAHAAKDVRTEISIRLQLARFLTVEAAKRVPDAASRADENLKLAQQASGEIEFADAQWRVAFLQGMVAQNAGRSAEAIGFYTQSVAKLDRLRAGLPQQEQRQTFMDDDAVQDLYQRLIGLLTTDGREAEAWEYLERGKARSFLEGLQGRRFRPASPEARGGELEKVEKQIVDLRVQLAPDNDFALRGSGKEPALLQTELQNLEARFTTARQDAALLSSRAAQPLSLRPIGFAELRKALPPHAALVEYAVLDGSLTAFIASKTGVAQIHWTANTKTLGAKIWQLRNLMSKAGTEAALDPLLQEISATLVAPVQKALPAGTTRLLIVPAQALHYIPFQALLLPDGRAMVEQYTISYLPSGSALQFLKTGESHGKADLYLGALGNVSVDGMVSLPGTLQETAGIEKLYPGSQRVVEAAFTHDSAVRALQEHDQVHFATHGLFDPIAPLFSSILTAPEAGEPSRISLYEVMDMKLRARLVVLSACETDRGKLMGGDEIAGLTRTFLLAGADTVVSSLWSVSDESTSLLMQGFYRRLKQGRPAADALRESQLEVRKQFPHPFFWAPFVETGVE
jgi:CHAT domain-containing protein